MSGRSPPSPMSFRWKAIWSRPCPTARRRSTISALSPIRPALIILDLFMPVMDGWQFLAEMKTDTKLSQVRIPVIVVTAFNAKVDEANAVIRKPIDLERLLHT